MPQYEIIAGSIVDAGEKLQATAAALDALYERLGAVMAEWPENLVELRRELSGEADAVDIMAGCVRNMGRTLHEAVEIYTQAEHAAFTDTSGLTGQILQAPVVSQPNIRKPAAVTFFGSMVMPDWLQAAVVRYEQAKMQNDGRRASHEL